MLHPGPTHEIRKLLPPLTGSTGNGAGAGQTTVEAQDYAGLLPLRPFSLAIRPVRVRFVSQQRRRIFARTRGFNRSVIGHSLPTFPSLAMPRIDGSKANVAPAGVLPRRPYSARRGLLQPRRATIGCSVDMGERV